MKTREQKSVELALGKKLLKESKNVVFADFAGVGIELIKRLKKELKKSGGAFKVIKKRLLRIAFKEAGYDYDPSAFDAQVGAVFIPGELTEGAAGVIHKFSKDLAKEKKDFKILGAYDLIAKKALTAQEFTIIAKLPSREVLLGQVANVLTGPIRAFMYTLQEIGKSKSQTVEAK